MGLTSVSTTCNWYVDDDCHEGKTAQTANNKKQRIHYTNTITYISTPGQSLMSMNTLFGWKADITARSKEILQ